MNTSSSSQSTNVKKGLKLKNLVLNVNYICFGIPKSLRTLMNENSEKNFSKLSKQKRKGRLFCNFEAIDISINLLFYYPTYSIEKRY